MSSDSHELRRELHLWDAVAAIIGTVVGAGIFRVPASVAQLIPDEKWILFAWILGGLLSLSGALIFAELAASYPSAGGEYVYLRESFGKKFSFIYGWTLFLVIRAGSLAGVAYIFAEYAGYFIPLNGAGIRWVATAGVLFLTGVNFLGVRYGRNVQSFFSGLKVAVLLFIVAIGWILGPQNGFRGSPGMESFHLSHVGAFGFAMIFVLWTYGGWNESAYLGEEIKNPERNLPLSIVIGILLVTALYVFVNWVYLHLLSIPEIQKSDIVASSMMEQLFGIRGGAFMALVIMLTCFGSMNTMILTDARIGYAVGKDYPRLGFLKKVHSVFRTPYGALILNAIWVTALIWTGSFERLVTYTSVVFWFFFGMTGVSFIILRRKGKLSPKFRVWGYPFTVIVFIATTVYLLLSTFAERPWDSLIGVGIAALGIPAYYLTRQKP